MIARFDTIALFY